VDSKHQKTLEAIFEKPERANILWHDIEALLIALGAEITDGNGSRRRVALKRCSGCVSPPASAAKKLIKVQ